MNTFKFSSAFLMLSLYHNGYSQSLGITGDAADVSTATSQGIVLMGGSTDVDNAMRWMITKSGGGDFVVIRASGTNAYNSYIYGLDKVNSVETLLIDSKADAQNPAVEKTIRDAEALFIAGGDQGNYVNYWKNTPVEDAINYLINVKKVPVGGTSAGCAILTRVYYSALSNSVTSSEALSDPYAGIGQDLLRDDFIQSPFLDNTVSDTHYAARTRQGRHVAFLARMIKDWSLSDVKGIGVDERTAVCIDESGKGAVYGSNHVFFLRQYCNNPETCTAGQKLHWTHGVKVYSVKGTTSGTNHFDLSNWNNGSGGNWEYWYVNNGVITTGALNPPVNCTTTSSGLSPQPVKPEIRIYPNPVKDELFCEFFLDDTEPAYAEITDMLGKVILTRAISSSERKNAFKLASTEILPAGVYVVRVSTKNGAALEKFVK